MSSRGPLATALCAAFFTLSSCTAPVEAPAEAPPEPAPPSWSAAMQAGIAAGEYAPKAMGNAYRVTNRAQDLRGVFGERGLAVTTRAGTGEVTLALRAWGRDAAMVRVEPRAPSEGPCLAGGEVDAFGVCLHRVDYAHPGLTEWWENRPAGLEQGFTVPSPPTGEGPLVFEMAVGGARVEVDGEEARLVREVGAPLRWGELVAWDEEGRELPAWMEAVDGGVRIEVDDSEAVGSVVVDPLLTTEVWRVESNQAVSYFGSSVASAGDVNGDGYGDVIVGATDYDNGQNDEGAAFLYLGSAVGLDTNADRMLESNRIGGNLGSSVSSAGDVNGDGYGDVVIGAGSYSGGTGAAFVYFGSALGLGETADWTIVSGQATSRFGYSISSAGDVNGDGYGDVVVGAWLYSNGESREGVAFVYLGSATGLGTTAATTLEANQADASFGRSVASAGDVNGDGYGDVVVGAYTYDRGQSDEGAAFVYLGSATGLVATPAATLESDQAGANFGESVASTGDINGDGYSDVVVGAPNYDNGSNNEGAAFVYLGSAAGLGTTAVTTLEVNQVNASFGKSVASAGDVNGDGYGDMVVGALTYNSAGAAFLYLGSAAGLSTTMPTMLEVNWAGAWFGGSAASAGDVNGDGYGDLLVGASRYDNPESDEGAAFLYLGSASGPATIAATTLEENQPGAYFGYSVASAGDVNGDGYGDVVVGAYRYDNGATDEGAVFAYLGSALGLATTAAWTVEVNQANASFGISTASAGDVNGDGYGDVVVGASYYDNGATDEGAAFVYLGSASGLATTAAWTAESNQATAYFGCSVSSAGDVNGDGYSDVIVGAYYHDNGQPNEGAASVFLGGAIGLATSPAWSAESNDPGAEFGRSVSSAGDVNGDGYGDVMVGASAYNTAGAAFVYLGSASGLATTAAWTAEADQADAGFGYWVSSAGDVNGDGFGDLVVGAHRYDNGATTDAGATFLYLGGGDGPATAASWTAEVNQAYAYFGHSVSSAGDVNGDGYGDVVVGAYQYDNGESNEGAAFMYLGSASGLTTTAAWTAESDHTGAAFGRSVASAGDVNGDGYGDLIVGAYGTGTAFVYLGNSGDGPPPRARVVQARQPGAATPIAPGLVSASSSSFVVAMTEVHTSWGRGRVKLQVEAKALGEPFDGTGFVSSPLFFAAPGRILQPTISSLTRATGYHWRARLVASPAEGRPQGWGPWFYGGLSGDAAGGHVFTAGTNTLYADTDGDGYGGSTPVASRGTSRPGFVNNNTDCNDADPRFHPGATDSETEGNDYNCDGAVACFVDADRDGYGATAEVSVPVTPGGQVDCTAPGRATTSTDCKDTDALFHPGATETTGAGQDKNCSSAVLCYRDADADGDGVSTSPLTIPVSPPGATISCTRSATQNQSATPAGIASSNNNMDCNDTTNTHSRNPQAARLTETVGAGQDYNCDGSITCYVDNDGDGDGSSATTTRATTGGGSPAACSQSGTANDTGDCNDNNNAIHPGAAEVCDVANTDENCDGRSDDAAALGQSTWYLDVDGDGFGGTTPGMACDLPDGYAANSADCDDSAPTVHPGAMEVCNEESNIDEDCDGQADDSSAAGQSDWYLDADGDGFGGAITTTTCDRPVGYVDNLSAGDCDDNAPAIHPNAAEICDDADIDEDCDGQADDSSAAGQLIWYLDGDDDGFGGTTAGTSCERPEGYSDNNADCDDADPAYHPGAPEDDCNDLADYNCDGASGRGDLDGDGFDACQDCDDNNIDVHPNAVEVCDPLNTDEDCDGLADDSSAAGQSVWYLDADGDGAGGATQGVFCDRPPGYASISSDCDDNAAGVHPSAIEICDDANTDEDCDELADDADPSSVGQSVGFVDGDGDGFGGTTEVSFCDLPAVGYSINSADCDDASAAVHPDATEICDPLQIDEDCDRLVDDEDESVTGRSLWYADGDRDGFGRGAPVESCEAPNGYVGNDSDCNDSVSTIKPGATEIVGTGIDEDCDGQERCFDDADDDGYLDLSGDIRVSADTDCADPREGTGLDPTTDCDDAAAARFPGADEITGNGIDEDCDGQEICFEDADNDGYLDVSGATRVSADADCADPREGTLSDLTTDCDDNDADRNPGVTEVIDNGVDEDCDGQELCFDDDDDDGYLDASGDTLLSADADCADPQEGTSSNPTTDCDDNNADRRPGAPEVIDNSLDEDCDDQETCFDDDDDDGYLDGSGDTLLSADADCADPREGASSDPTTDCDDNNADRRPGGTEVIDNGLDDDCDGQELCFDDDDDDGYLDPSGDTRASDDADCDGAYEGTTSDLTTDCDDNNADRRPGAPEVIDNGADEDCDGQELCFDDDDDDGYLDGSGDTRRSADADCADPREGMSSDLTTDCDDNDADRKPGVTEVIDNDVDEDCDGQELCFDDDDDDGYLDGSGDTRASADADCDDAYEGTPLDPTTDCDDAAPGRHPDATELSGNGVDEDCDGQELCFEDADDDGYVDSSGATLLSADVDCDDAYEGESSDPTTDCDEADAGRNPDATEVPGSGVDEDCDGQELCFDDADDDGYLDALGVTRASDDADCDDAYEGTASDPTTDCDDADADRHPSAEENCEDTEDYNCDGSSGVEDGDEDGYDCDDCDDEDAAIHPGATEICDSLNTDEDCDGFADDEDEDPEGRLPFYVDADGDGYGSDDVEGTAPVSQCDPSEGRVAISGDCDDTKIEINPDAAEVYNNTDDEDCSGVSEQCREDLDGDGAGGAKLDSDPCAPKDVYTLDELDCNDANATIHPKATDVPGDGIDQNCDDSDSGCSCATRDRPDLTRLMAGFVVLWRWKVRRNRRDQGERTGHRGA